MINYQFGATILRYIVPFTYEGDFDEACAKIDREDSEGLVPGKPSDRGWIRYTPSMVRGESDLYAYIREEFMFDDQEEKLSDKKNGAQWIHRKINRGAPLAELLFLPNYKIKASKGGKNPQIEPEVWDGLYANATHIDLAAMGLYLFRNGLGFIWYELDPGKISSDNLVEMQNIIKELNRTTKIRLLKIEKKPVNEGAVVHRPVIENEAGRFYGKETYLTPLFLGKMLADTLRFLDVTFLTERRSTYADMIKTGKRFIEAFPNEKKEYSEDTLAHIEEYPVFPDKAVLFSYGYLYNPDNPEDVGEESDRCHLTFYLTKGYTPAYEYPPKVAEKMINPFNNAYWYASSEGVSYFKWGNSEKSEFFTGGIIAKIKNDYFALYIKTLYQSYSLLLLARKIQKDIPAEHIGNMSDGDYERIAKRYEEINLFLTKSMATSVSHIDHQSEFYIYLKQQLRIAEDARSIGAGLDAVDALQKEERHRKEAERLKEESRLEKEKEEEEKQRDNSIQRVLEVISLLAIASAFIDSYDFISKLAIGEEESWLWMLQEHRFVFFIELIVIAVIILIAVRGIFLIRKNTKKRQKDKEG